MSVIASCRRPGGALRLALEDARGVCNAAAMDDEIGAVATAPKRIAYLLPDGGLTAA
jgi:hypothetical protein